MIIDGLPPPLLLLILSGFGNVSHKSHESLARYYNSHHLLLLNLALLQHGTLD